MRKVFVMRMFLPIIIIFFIGISCASQKKMGEAKTGTEGMESAEAKESIEYGIETFDARFEAWYQRYNNKTIYHSQDYYEYWNNQYVSNWNTNASEVRENNFFEPIVGYSSNIKYGLELNHKLFYYFQYVENILKIKIMDYSPKAVPFQ